MKQFKFRLSSLLALREIETAKALEIYSSYLQKRKEKEAIYEQTKISRALLEEELYNMRQANITAYKHKQYMQALDVIKDNLKQNTIALNRAQEEERKYFKLYLTAKQKEDTISKYKEKKLEQFKKELLNKEEKELDEKRFLSLMRS